MSSTNRGGARSPADFYATPDWCVESLMLWLGGAVSVVDPCAGDGAILRVVRRHGIACVRGIELREECRPALEETGGGFTIANAIGDSILGPFPWETVIANPPYSQAQAFVERWAHPAACAAFLLRLNFLGSVKRAAWWRARMPSHVLVLSRRPSFTNGGTDSCDYAWFVWQRDVTRSCLLEVLP